jgi:acyl-CoA thioesterase I
VTASFEGGLPLTAYNLGVRGETSLDVAGRWRDEARPRLRADCACGMVLSFGVNDTAGEGGGVRVEPEQAVDALARILDGASQRALPAFVVGPPPAGEPAHDERVRGLSEAFGSAAAARGVPFVAVVDALRGDGAWTTAAAMGDGSHPGADGYEALALLVLDGGWRDWLANLRVG